MLVFCCDRCRQPLGENDLRYVVRLQAHAALQRYEDEADREQDPLQELHDILEQLDDEGQTWGAPADDLCSQNRFDLCRACYREFSRDPLGASRATARRRDA